jgi:hypothetical protein
MVWAEFQVDVYLPQPSDPVLSGPKCAVAGWVTSLELV